jgi:hypothetical protein
MRSNVVVLATILLAGPACAADREVIRSGWSGFQGQVAARKLTGRSVRIVLSSGGQVKTDLLEVTDSGLAVRATRATKQWKSSQGYARIPREQIATVRFGGRVGSHGLIGALAGLGAGAGIGAAVANGISCNEGSCLYIKPPVGAAFVATGVVAGYFIGRATGRPAPEFVLTR